MERFSAIACFLLLALLLAIPAAAVPVGTITVAGNQRIEAATVRSYLGFGAGESVDAARLDQALVALYGTGLFRDVRLSLAGAELTVTVAENPVINRIAFEGTRAIEAEELEKEIQLKPRQVFTARRAQADVERLLALYRRQGRFGAAIEPKVIALEQNRVDLVFEIREGPRTGVRAINFIGNTVFSESDLRDVIATRETAWWRFLSSSDSYDPDRIDFDREQLRRFYLNNGYADFRVISALAELSPERDDFIITFTVEEGPRYRVGTVTVDSAVKDLPADAFQPTVAVKAGDWYNAAAVEDTVVAMTELAGDQQYAFLNVVPDLQRDRAARTIDLTLRVQEGQRVFVERVDVVGNTRTEDRVIRREIALAEGDPFNLSKLRRSEQRLRDLGYFKDATLTPSEGAQPDRTVLEAKVTEQPTGELSIGAGFSSVDGALGDFSLRERNFLGRGQDARLGFTLSQRSQQIDFSFTEPYFLDRDLSAGFDLFRTIRNNQDESSFDQRNTGFSTRLGYPLSDYLRQKLNYTLTRVEITNVASDASRFIREQAGERVTSLVGQELTYDRRDSRLNPTEGYVLRLNSDVAGLGGDARYVRNRLLGSWYYPLQPQWIISATAEVGHIAGLQNDPVRINDRFFLGGDSLRGFDFAGIGPRDLSTRERDALGGNRFWRTSAELALPSGLPEDLGIGAHLFTDAGALANNDLSAQAGEVIVNDDSIRMSVGVGVSWQSPLGPIRIDFAQPVKKENYDQVERFRFSFGTRF